MPTTPLPPAETFSIFVFASDLVRSQQQKNLRGGARHGVDADDGHMLHNDVLRTLWMHLRSAVLLVMRPLDESSDAIQAAERAVNHLFAYGKLAEEKLGECVHGSANIGIVYSMLAH